MIATPALSTAVLLRVLRDSSRKVLEIIDPLRELPLGLRWDGPTLSEGCYSLEMFLEYPKDSCVKNLVLNMEILMGGGVFKRWSQ